jgi:hypothetical protein
MPLFDFVIEGSGLGRYLDSVEQGEIGIRHIGGVNGLTVAAFQAVIFVRRQDDEILAAMVGDHDRLALRKAAHATEFALKFDCGDAVH